MIVVYKLYKIHVYDAYFTNEALNETVVNKVIHHSKYHGSYVYFKEKLVTG